MLHSKKNSKDQGNDILCTVNGKTYNKDILDVVVYDENNVSYTVNDLLCKIFELEDANTVLLANYKTYQTSTAGTLSILAQAADITSAKIAELEYEVEVLQSKTAGLD